MPNFDDDTAVESIATDPVPTIGLMRTPTPISRNLSFSWHDRSGVFDSIIDCIFSSSLKELTLTRTPCFKAYVFSCGVLPVE